MSAEGERAAALAAMITADPTDAFAHYALGLERRAEGDIDAATALLERALELDPEEPATCYQLGELLRDEGEGQRAREVIERGIGRARREGQAKMAGELATLLASL